MVVPCVRFGVPAERADAFPPLPGEMCRQLSFVYLPFTQIKPRWSGKRERLQAEGEREEGQLAPPRELYRGAVTLKRADGDPAWAFLYQGR
jgi:hypothetical protein